MCLCHGGIFIMSCTENKINHSFALIHFSEVQPTMISRFIGLIVALSSLALLAMATDKSNTMEILMPDATATHVKTRFIHLLFSCLRSS